MWLSRVEHGGQEHDVYEPDDDPLIYKLTKRSAFGYYASYKPDSGELGMRPATAIEYLDRLLISNEFFGDDIQLEGIGISSGGSIYTLTSQPFIEGEAASVEEIRSWLSGAGFMVVDEQVGGWIHPEERVAVWDAKPRNVVRDNDGRILPIDLILGRF